MSQRVSKFYVVRTIGGRELDVALLIESRAKERNLDIRSVIIPPRVKGLVLVEAPASFIVSEAIRGIRYARGVAPGFIEAKEIRKVFKPEVKIEIKPGDVVEIISGPFRGFRGRVERVDAEHQMIEVTLLDASYNLRLTIPLNTVRPVEKGGSHGA